MKNTFLLFIASIFLFHVSCTAPRQVIVHKTLDTVIVSGESNPMDIYRASAPRWWNLLDTRVSLSFHLAEKTADGKEWLVVQPYFYPMDTLTLNAKSMRIDSVMILDGGRAVPIPFFYRGDSLQIVPGRTYTRNEKLKVYIRYTALPYAEATGGSSAISEDRGLYFINTDRKNERKPTQIWTQGETESNSHWLPTLDKPNMRTPIRIELTVPDSFTTLSNGVLIESRKIGSHLREDIWQMEKPIQVYAIMFAIGKFAVVEDTPVGTVPVKYYVEPEYAPYAREMFQHTPEMIRYFSEITGVPYPWNKYSQVVVRDYVSGAMENTTASLFGEFMNQNAREIKDRNYEDVVSHELFHQWFGDYVTAESWSNVTVNESFANYGEQLWRRYKYGPASADELAFEDLNKYLNQTAYNDAPLVRFHYITREEVFDRISYEKGGAVLGYLHGLMGDEAFKKAVQIYLTKNALQSAEAHNWRLAVEEATGLDWNWFFNQWYFRGGHPDLEIDYDYNDAKDSLKVSVTQTTEDDGQPYILPLKAALIYGDKKEVINWIVSKKKETFTFSYKDGARPVFIPDQQHWLPGNIKENKPLNQWLAQFRHSDDYINKRRALTAAFQSPGDSATAELFRTALKDSLPQIQTFALFLLQNIDQDQAWIKSLKQPVSFLALQSGSASVRAAAIALLGRWKTEGMQEEMLQATKDSSYRVAGAALLAYSQVQNDSAYLLAKRMAYTQPKAELESAIWHLLATHANSEDLSILESAVPEVSGKKAVTLATNIFVFEQNTQSLASFEKGLVLLGTLAANESIKPYRFSIGSLVFGLHNFYEEKEKQASSSEKLMIENKQKLLEQYEKKLVENERDPSLQSKYRALR